MSDIRFNQWLHQSGTGGVSQVDGGHVGIGTTNPDIAVHTANTKKINVGIVTANSVYAGAYYGDGSNLTGLASDKIEEGDTKVEVVDSGDQYIIGEVNGSEKIRIASDGIITQSATHPQIILKDPSNRQVSLRSPSSSNLAALGTDSSHDLIFYTNGYSNEHLRIKSDGRVRIGEAGGNEGSYRAAIIEETSNTTTASTQLLLYAKHDGTGNTGVGFGGGIRFWGDRNSDNAVQNMGRIMCIADVNSGTNLSGALAFETASSGVNSEKLRITSVGDVQIKVDGNGGASSQQGVLRFYRTSYSGDMKDSRIVFDTSSGTNNDDNNKYCSVIAGKRTASNNGSSDLRFYTCKDENSYTVAERLRITESGTVAVTSHNFALGNPDDNVAMQTVTKRGFLGSGSNATLSVGTAYAGGRIIAHCYKTADSTKQTTYYADFQARGTGNGHRTNERTTTQNSGVNFSVTDDTKGFKITNNETFTIKYAMMIEIVGDIPVD